VSPQSPLPDYLPAGVTLLLVGFNPGLTSAARGHYYAGRGSRLWDLLADSGITGRRLHFTEDALLPVFGVGVTDLVKRPSGSAGELSPWELRQGGERVRRILAEVRPAALACLGKGVYRAVAGAPPPGRGATWPPYGEAAPVDGVPAWVLPSPSGRSGLPYAVKLETYRQLAAALWPDTTPEGGDGAGANS
jgi:G:T/U-mismatch repair DNA glycosylase